MGGDAPIAVDASASIGRRYFAQIWHQRRDVIVAVFLFVATFVAAWTFLAKTGVSEFYEIYFSPAVNFACTGSFAELDHRAPALAALAEFLDRKADAFDCASLPSDLGSYVRPMDVVQYATVYLIGTAALIWRFAGVSWAALVPIGSALAAMFGVSIYGLSRLFVGRILALGVVAAALCSPLHLAAIHALRDYSKAPFIVGSVFFIGVAVLGGARGKLIGYAIAGGIVAGLGLGFRSDAALVVPFCMIVMLTGAVFARGKQRSAFFLALGGFLAAFALAGIAPLLASIRGGGIFGHVALLGLTTPFDAQLGVTPTFYDVGNLYSDRAVTAFVNGFEAFRHQDAAQDLAFNSPPYNRAAATAYLTYAVNFPADLLARTYAAILRVLETLSLPSGLAGIWPLTRIQAILTTTVALPLLVFCALSLLSACRVAAGAFLSFFVIWFAGSTSVQFHTRHAFYLEFVNWLVLAILFSLLIKFLMRRPLPVNAAYALLPTGMIVVLLCSLWAARLYQSAHVPSLFAAYETAPRQPVEVERKTQGGEVLMMPTGRVPDILGHDGPFDRARTARYYLVVSLDSSRCQGKNISVTFQYAVRDDLKALLPTNDFTRKVEIVRQVGVGPVKIFAPVSVTSASAFEALHIARDQEACLQSVEAMSQTRDLPLPLWIVQRHDGRSANYQTLSRF